MTILDLTTIFIVVIIGLLIWKQMEISQSARAVAANYCTKQNVVLLDQTVFLSKLRLSRAPKSIIRIERHYQFEFSSVGDRRYKGCMIFKGKHLAHIEMDAFRVD